MKSTKKHAQLEISVLSEMEEHKLHAEWRNVLGQYAKKMGAEKGLSKTLTEVLAVKQRAEKVTNEWKQVPAIQAELVNIALGGAGDNTDPHIRDSAAALLRHFVRMELIANMTDADITTHLRNSIIRRQSNAKS